MAEDVSVLQFDQQMEIKHKDSALIAQTEKDPEHTKPNVCSVKSGNWIEK